MRESGDINEYVRALLASDRLGNQVAYHREIGAKPPEYANPEKPFPKEISDVMRESGIPRLYSHQAKAIDLLRAGQNVVAATPTASGKTCIYNLPAIEKILDNPSARALYVFPLKALAQDQKRAFSEMASVVQSARISCEIYDGDTSAWHRRRIREQPPNVLITNPEMVHLSMLAYHDKWAAFLSGLEFVVVDEVHTYRGVMGSHVAQVFRRLSRVCRFYGASPSFLFSSATVANPGRLASDLTGLPVETVTESGAPAGKKHLVFINPDEGPARTAILLLKAALHRELRTIVYTKSRKMTELIAMWAERESGRWAGRISAYRAGFLPGERREIEARLSSGDLLAVVSTSALELGIDIGDLDLCVLVGYPGTVMATWQRGGRVGRSGQDSALALIAGEDALDQYFMRHPGEFVRREPEAAVVNPHNPNILEKHLVCAASELPLKIGEPITSGKAAIKVIAELERKGELLRSATGKEFYSRRRPHMDVSLRGTGTRYRVICGMTGRDRGEIDGFRVFKDMHPGAVYIHRSVTHIVDGLDAGAATVRISPAQVDFYTKPISEEHTEILEIFDEKPLWGGHVFFGRLKVTERITGYEKWWIRAKRKLDFTPLELPPMVFETEGMWFVIPLSLRGEIQSKYPDFPGAIHAVEHAAIGVFPLLVMADRNDLGGLSTSFHPQTGGCAIFIYDGIPGGAGLCREAFGQAGPLLDYAYDAISGCACKTGCPSCVHSPKCGSGNHPIDKNAAAFLLERLKETKPGPIPMPALPAKSSKPLPKTPRPNKNGFRFGVLDIETQRSAAEVGGWHRADLMKISCVVVYDSKNDRYHEYLEHQADSLLAHMEEFDLLIGFNIVRFDYRVLEGYLDYAFDELPTLDILRDVYQYLGHRVSLDRLASSTLGRKKTADGLQALVWWKQGRIRDIIDYCRVDVEITKDLYLFGKKNGFLLVDDKSGNTVRVPVEWGDLRVRDS